MPNLWGLGVGLPGSMKSPALAEALRPLRRLITDAQARDEEHRLAQRMWLAEQKARRHDLARRLADAVASQEPTEHLREPVAEATLSRRRSTLMRARRLPDDGLAAYRVAQKRGWEGIVAKDAASPNEPGRRSRSWLKVKCRKEAELVIGGFTAPAGRRRHLGALLLGLFDGLALRFVGKVGTGFSERMLRDLSARMHPLQTDEAPFRPVPREKGASWVRPQLVAQIAFTEWTADGKLRQPVFLGLRDDKKASECTWRDRER